MVVRLTSDIDAAEDFVASAVLGIGLDVLTLAGMVVVMFYLDWRFSLIGLSVSPVLFVTVYRMTGRIKRATRVAKRQESALASVVQESIASAEILSIESQVRDRPGAREAPPFRGRIEFDQVRCGYIPERAVLTELRLVVEPGQHAALVGLTGSGKSTLIGVVARMYDPTGGRVLVDGRDVREYTLASLRRQVSFVLQDAVLFRASIAQNTAYGRPGIGRDDIVRAAMLANAHEFIMRLPQRYDTVVGERGETLSGGQRQRIAIARAIVRDAPILLFDEPSAALDPESEELVFQGLSRLMTGRTSITIARRLATVRRADVIFVLDEGRIVERGTHLQLLAAGGLYAGLHHLQYEQRDTGRPETPPIPASRP